MDWRNRVYISLVEETRKRSYRYGSGAGDPTKGQQARPSRGKGVKEIAASKKKGSPHRQRMAGHIRRLRKHYEEHPEDRPTS